VVEEPGFGDACVVDVHKVGAGVLGELPGVDVPHRPDLEIVVDEDRGVAGANLAGVLAGGDGVQPIRPDQARVQLAVLEVLGAHRAQGEVQGTVLHAGRLRVGGNDPGVHKELGHPCGACHEVGGQPADVAEADRFGPGQLRGPPAQVVRMPQLVAGQREESGAGGRETHRRRL
jgi:hypothetical protein